MGQATPSQSYHRPVLVAEVAELLEPAPDGWLLDATFGSGGHSAAILRCRPDLRVLAIDRDPDAADHAVDLDPRIRLVTADFKDLAGVAAKEEIDELAAAVFDLGVSSHQLDEAGRGFSFHRDGPLDMRMGPDAPLDAAAIVNEWDRADIARILRRFGEEPYAARVADAIVAARPLRSTLELADVAAGAIPAAARRRRHPARRTFQAIRMAVNDELVALTAGLDAAIDLLVPGGRVAVIAYHSLEDRIVKRRFARGSEGCVCPPDLPVCGCGRTAELRLVGRKPIRPSTVEVERNPRSRSARLRGAERVGP